MALSFEKSNLQEYFEWTGRSLRWADTSGVEAVHSRLRYQQLANNTRITNPAKFGTPIHKTKLRKSLVYFAGKNLGKVAAESDSEDEDLPGEVGDTNAPPAADQGAAAGDLLGEGDAGGQAAAGVETGADDVTSDPTTPKTTGRKYRKRQDILDENNLLKIEISELRRKHEEEIQEKNKIIGEKEKLIEELMKNQ